MVTSGKSIKEVVEHAINVEGLEQDFNAKSTDIKAKNGGSFNGSFSKGPIPLAPISGVFICPVKSALQLSSGCLSGTTHHPSGQ